MRKVNQITWDLLKETDLIKPFIEHKGQKLNIIKGADFWKSYGFSKGNPMKVISVRIR